MDEVTIKTFDIKKIQNDAVIIIGKRGTGKSVLATDIINNSDRVEGCVLQSGVSFFRYTTTP